MEKESDLTRPLVPNESDDGLSSIDDSYSSRREPQKARVLLNILIAVIGLIATAAIFISGVYVGSRFDFESRCAEATTQWCKSSQISRLTR
jgi:hypothetical protein